MPKDAISDSSALQTWRTNTLNVVLIALTIAVPAAMYNVVVDAIQTPAQRPAGIIFTLCYGLVIVVTIWRGLDFNLRAWGLLLVGYAAGALAFMRGGLAGDGRVYILGLPVVAFILFGNRTGFAATGLSLALYAVFGYFAHSGQMAGWLLPRFQTNPLAARDWIQGGANVVMILAPVALLLWRFISFHEKTLRTEQQATQEWARASTLANERAAELERANVLLAERSEALTAAATITRQIASLTDEQSMLEQFVRLAAEQLKLDNANLFLLDAQQNYATLRASAAETPEPGQVAVKSDDPIGRAARGLETALTRDSLDRWRMTIPLRVRGETLGVLDVYFKVGPPPSPEKQEIIRTLTDQLAISLKNTRLLQDVQTSLAAEREARGELSRQAWDQVLGAARQIGFLRDKSGTRSIKQTKAAEAPEHDPDLLTIPILVRNQPIGVIQARRSRAAGGWTPEHASLMETVVEQLGAALESARLYQETQRRAAQEKLIGEIASHMRQSLDISSVLQTVAREMRQALNLAQVEVRLKRGASDNEVRSGV